MAKTITNSPAANNELPATHFIQNNLCKKINATNSIIKDLKPSTVLLLTEPNTNKYRRIPSILSIPESHKPFISLVEKPRAAIILPLGLHSHSIRLGQFSSPDIATGSQNSRLTLADPLFCLHGHQPSGRQSYYHKSPVLLQS